MNRLAFYSAPEGEIQEDFRVENVVCTSPGAGGLEDIEYEDWVIQ